MLSSRQQSDRTQTTSLLRVTCLCALGIIATVLVLAGCGSGGASTPRSYALQELGTSAQANDVWPAAVNNRGQGVGYKNTANPVPDSTHAYLLAIGSLQDIASQSGILLELTFGINDANQVLCSGFYQTSPYAPGRWFLYDGGTVTDLDPPASTPHHATAINANGQIAGDNGLHLARYARGAWQDLGAPTGSTSLTASCINASGDIAGTFSDSAQMTHVFLYKNAGFTDVGPVASVASGLVVSVVGIDDNDRVAFNIEQTGGANAARMTRSASPTAGPYLWDSAHGIQALAIPQGVESGAVEIEAMNRGGDIVGRDLVQIGSAITEHILVWHNRQPTDITALNPTLSAWNLVSVYAPALNDRGQILALGTARTTSATGTPVFADHLFLLTPH